MYFRQCMGRWRGYIVSEFVGKRLAMRSPHTASSKRGAIADIKRENREWESVNSSKEYKKSFGAYEVPEGERTRFKPGFLGNRDLLRWHDAQKRKDVANRHGVNFGKTGYNRFTSSY